MYGEPHEGSRLKTSHQNSLRNDWLKNEDSGGGDPSSIEDNCQREPGRNSDPASSRLPLQLGWWRKDRWNLPSSTDAPATAKDDGQTSRHSERTSKLFRWLMQMSRNHRRNRECASTSDENRLVGRSACEGNCKPALSASGLQLFALCYVAYAVLYFTRKPFSVVKEEIRSQLGLSTFALGWIDTAFLGCYAGCFFGSFVTAFAFGCFSSSMWFVVLWGLNGLVHSPAFPIFIKILSNEVSPRARGSVMGIWTTSQQLGGIAATVFCSLVDWAHGWRWSFFSSALLCLFGGFALRALLPKFATEAFDPRLPVTTEEAPLESQTAKSELPIAGCKAPTLGGLPVLVQSDGGQSEEITYGNFIELGALRTQEEAEDTSSPCTEESYEDEFSPVLQALNPVGANTPVNHLPGGGEVRLSTANPGCSSTGGAQWKGALLRPNTDKPPLLEGLQAPSDTSASCSPEESDESSSPASSDYEHMRSNSREEPFRLSGMIIFCSCAFFFVKFVRYTLAFWLPFFLCRHGNLSVMSAGLSSMSVDVGGVVGAVLGGLVADRLLKGRRLSLAALMCVATGICLFLVALSSRHLEHLRLSGEELVFEEQLALQGLQRTLQEDWSRIEDVHSRETNNLPTTNEQVGGRIELDEEQVQKQAFHERRPLVRKPQLTDGDALQENDEIEQHFRRGTTADATAGGGREAEVVVGEAAAAHMHQINRVLEEGQLYTTSSAVGTVFPEVEQLDSEQERRIAAVQRHHEERLTRLKSKIKTKENEIKAGRKWQLAQLLGCMLLVGFFNAVPDSVLGASAAQDLLELPGAVRSNVGAVAAFINAVGALGALCQGVCTAAVSELFGWGVLFGLLCVLSFISAILLLPAALREGSKD